MSNGLGAGFFAITLLAILAGLAILVILTTIAIALYHRRANYTPMWFRYLLVVLCAGVLGVAGVGILVLYDEAPAAAWVFTSFVGGPFLVVSIYLLRTTESSRFDVVVTTVMAWGVPFFIGVFVALGALYGINSVFDLAPAESRQMGVAWIAAAGGGITIVGSMIPIGNRLRKVLYSKTAPQ